MAATYPVFAASETALWVVAVIGGFTAIFAASIALTQTDIKRVLAYSTVSQLGYMMLALGVGGYVAGVFTSLPTPSLRRSCSLPPAALFMP